MNKLSFALLLVFCLTISAQDFQLNKCFNSVGHFTTEITKLVNKVLQKNVDVGQFAEDSYTLFAELDPILGQCNIRIPFLKKFQEIGPARPKECFNDIGNLWKNVLTAYETIQDQSKLFTLMGLIGEFTNNVKKVRADCEFTKIEQHQLFSTMPLLQAVDLLEEGNSAKCIESSHKVANDSLGIAFALANKSVNGTIAATIQVLKELPQTLLNCGQTKIYDAIKVFETIQFDECGQDLQEIWVHCQGFYQNIKNKQYFSLISNGQGIYHELQDLYNHCQKKKQLELSLPQWAVKM